jgi:peptidoglycan/xylan/chitin deacetylase (PgdA/CDA1 family)
MTRHLRSVRRVIRKVERWLHGGRYILAYHRVARVEHDPWGLAVQPELFAQQLQVLRRYGAVMTVERMMRELAAGALPRRAYAVTFDDGYIDNLLTAKPLLERYEVPATVFLCAGLLEGRGWFWWDALLYLLMEPAALPERLEIALGKETYRFTLSHAATQLSRQGYRDWRYWQPPPSQRHAIYLELSRHMSALSVAARHEALSQLSAWANVGLPALPDSRPMTWEDAAKLADGGLIEIGAHTLTHPSLPDLDTNLQRQEILGSKAACEEIAGRRLFSFAYPHGRHAPDTVKLVRDAGFSAACTTAAGAIQRSSDPLRLPRIQMFNWDGAELERLIKNPSLF